MSNAAVTDFIDVEELFEFVKALRGGDFTKRLNVPETGRAREVATHLNRHMEAMGQMLSEVTRVAKETGVEGRLGAQAEVVVTGSWRAMTDAVNLLSSTVTENVRDMVWTVEALNKENRFRKVHESCDGEWKQLKGGINTLVERAKAQAVKAP
jgi:osomolarity two-component system, sensor histidine kinase NIK1